MVPPPLCRCHRHHRRSRPRHNNKNTTTSMMGSTTSALDDYVMSILQSRNASEFKVVTDAAALPTNELLDQVYSSRYTTRNSCSSSNNNNTTSDHSRISLDFTTLKDDFYSEEEEECKKYRLEQSTIMEMDISDWLSGDSSCEHHQSSSSSCFQKDLPSSSSSSYNDIMRRPSDVPQAKIAVPRSA
eukprot:scaffold4004_cov105-Cylindrotheca_fusiformis.AAC.15